MIATNAHHSHRGTSGGVLRIGFDTESFPAGTVPNGHAELSTSWSEILWAAVTVGRPSRQYVFRHGAASLFEALFRWSLVRMALEQSGSSKQRLRRTQAAKTLDPTEKGAVNYFLGMTFCKLFAARLLNTPWLLHLDVFRPALNAVLSGRSRPDLVGLENGTTRWHSFECKGRINPPDKAVKGRAKAQAQRLIRVNGTACTLHIGAITFFRGDVLNLFWRDPEPAVAREISIQLDADAWRSYYLPAVQAVAEEASRRKLQEEIGEFVRVSGLDLEVGVHPVVATHLFKRQWASAQRAAVEASKEIHEAGYEADGLAVRAGDTWQQRFEESPGEA